MNRANELAHMLGMTELPFTLTMGDGMHIHSATCRSGEPPRGHRLGACRHCGD
jgi:hypothetical protein